MDVDDGAALPRRGEGRDEGGRRGRRHGQDHALPFLQGDAFGAEVEVGRGAARGGRRGESRGRIRGRGLGRAARPGNPAQPPPEPNRRPSPPEEHEGRIHERMGESDPRDPRPAGRLPPREGLAQHGPQQAGRAGPGRRVQRRDRKRLPEPLEQRPAVPDAVRHRAVGSGRREPQGGGEVVPGLRVGSPPPGAQEPPRQPSAVGPQGPSLPGPDVEERKAGRDGADQSVGGPDVGKVAHGGPVAAQQQVVAVVDQAAEPRVGVRAAAPAGPPAGLVEGDRPPRERQGHRGGEAGEAGADDVGSGRGAGVGSGRRGRQRSPY